MIKINDNAMKVLEKRYLAKDSEGKVIEDVEGMFRRVAITIASEEQDKDKWTEVFYNMMANLEFLPNSPCLMNAGKSDGQLSACFVLPLEDSIDSIFNAIKNGAMVHKSGGGTGYDFTKLRPKNSVVQSTKGVSSGPISFMKIFNEATEQIKQGGARRGANMGMLNVHHPDILEFIECKSDLTQFTNFNISIAVTDVFMQAVINGTNYPIYHESDNKERDMLNARDVFNKICDQAWKTGEPGIIFIDEINRYNPNPSLGDMNCTNPCVIGDTLVQTVEGQIKIKDLVGKEIDVYTMDNEGNLAIRKAKNIRMTKRNAKLLEIDFSRTKLICTPDHEIYIQGKGYVEAKDIQIKDKPIGLKRQMRSERCTKVSLSKSNKFTAEHRLVLSHYQDITNKDVHHIDGDMYNNKYSNLEALSHGEHSRISNEGHEDWNKDRDSMGRFIKKEIKKKKCSEATGRSNINYRVKSIRELDYTEDVYDLEVEEFHNFIANDVVIHNCGEIPLLPYEACNLGSINLNTILSEDNEILWDKLERITRHAVRFLDNVIDISQFPIQDITDQVRRTRKIGLGIMGFADFLIKLNIPYDTDTAIFMANDVMEFINTVSAKESINIAQEKGIIVDNYRNSTRTTIAPTGTISMIADCSGGLEPIFAVAFKRFQADMEMYEVNKIFKQIAIKQGFYSEDLIQEIVNNNGSVQGLSKVPRDIQHLFKTANEISTTSHVKMQASFQKHVNNSISKTINLPNSATIEDVSKAYLLAYELKCKGVTVYRDGSRYGQVLSTASTTSNDKVEEIVDSIFKLGRGVVLDCSDDLIGRKKKIQSGCGTMHIQAWFDPDTGDMMELFLSKGSQGGCLSNTMGLSRVISLALRGGIPLNIICDQLDSVPACPSYALRSATKKDTSRGSSCPMAIGKIIMQLQKDIWNELSDTNMEESNKEIKVLVSVSNDNDNDYQKCPECGEQLSNASGCIVCTSCGWGKCT